MKRKVWTATAHSYATTRLRIVIKAQCKSSRSELTRRILADDPIWLEGVTYTMEKRWPNRAFRRGLAFRCFDAETV